MYNKNTVFHIKVLDQTITKKLMKGRDIKNHLSPTQIRIVLYMLEHKNEVIYQKNIETHLGLSRATVSDVLNTMEKKGYIKKVVNLEDARINNVVLNDIALEKHEKAMEKLKEINNTLQNNISKEDLDIFIKVIKQMQENLNSTID